MESVNQLESNVINSFKFVKDDVYNLKENLRVLIANQTTILNALAKLENKEQGLYQTVKDIKFNNAKKVKRVVRTHKVIVKSVKKSRFVASKTGQKFHKVNCPFGKNIKPKMKVIFKSKNTALNAGYKPCTCTKF